MQKWKQTSKASISRVPTPEKMLEKAGNSKNGYSAGSSEAGVALS